MKLTAIVKGAEGPLWVRLDKTQSEHNASGLPLKAEVRAHQLISRSGHQPTLSRSQHPGVITAAMIKRR